MPIETAGYVIVAGFTFLFGWMIFRGMVIEWHRDAAERRDRAE